MLWILLNSCLQIFCRKNSILFPNPKNCNTEIALIFFFFWYLHFITKWVTNLSYSTISYTYIELVIETTAKAAITRAYNMLNRSQSSRKIN